MQSLLDKNGKVNYTLIAKLTMQKMNKRDVL